ncbi:MAG TPA: class I SAM-dependent methyltransferase [Pyrinomonadaceae bacterium]|nr:class I SAM-dependent methyltransferase [Pyrinomonadaceae bacterium]
MRASQYNTKSAADLFKSAGVEDLARFYRERFFTGGVFDARYFDAVHRFDIKFARTMWVYDNVRRGSSLLDLGCGEGMLALLKRKDVKLTGVDLSPEFAEIAMQNGYDEAHVAQLTSLPFADASFDYVVSLDVIGHVGFDEKDAVIREIKRVLRPDGVTMHGIEVLNRSLHREYDSMSEEELRKFISVDGHIGLEDEEQNAERFRRYFSYVETEPRYSLCLSRDEILKQSEQYGMAFDEDFLAYLRKLSFNERRAFDMAMGYIFGKISDLHVKLPEGLYLFLKASNTEPEPFYNAHRDHSDLLPRTLTDENGICVDRDSRATFDNGWYAVNNLPPLARWMGRRATIQIAAESISRIRLDLTTHIPNLGNADPLGLEFFLNGVSVCALSLINYGWLELDIQIPESSKFDFEIRADGVWQPVHSDPSSSDDRELSIAVCNIVVFR